MRSNYSRFVKERLLPSLMMLMLYGVGAIDARFVAAGTPEGTQFATDIARSNAALLRASQVAQKTSRDPQLREFSSRIAADAADADEALSRACERSGIKLPRPAADASVLPAQGDATFDRVYTLEVSQQLAKVEALLTSASKSNAVDEALRRFAEQRLPAVRENRKRADAIARAQAGVQPAG